MDVAIVLNGPKLDVDIAEEYIVCADGGYNLIKEFAVPAIVIGDMDSIGDLSQDVRTITIPKEKDYTDGEYAIRLVSKMQGVENIFIYAAFGGRFDHQLANLGLLKLAHNLGKQATIVEKDMLVTYGRGKVEFDVEPLSLISLISAEGDVVIKKGSGLLYPVDNLDLASLDSRGISNVATSGKVEIEIKKGGVFLFRLK